MRRVDFIVLHQGFLLARLQAERDRTTAARIQAAFGHRGSRRADGSSLPRGRGWRPPRSLDSTVSASALKADRAARRSATSPSRARPASRYSCDIAGIQHGDHGGREQVVGLVAAKWTSRRRGRRPPPAARRRACAVPACVHVLEHVAAAVHARALAVPHREHAVVVAAAGDVQLLRAPHRGGRELLVTPGRNLIAWAASRSSVFHSASSRPPSGEPR